MAPKRFKTRENQRLSFLLLARMSPKRNLATSLLRIMPRKRISTPLLALEMVAFYNQPTPLLRKASLGASSISTWMAALESS
jgi:hypothetical protein